MPTVSKYAIWTLYFIVFVDLFQLTFVYPFIPTIVSKFLNPDNPNDPAIEKTTARNVAILSSTAAIGEAVGSPIIGWLSDKFGRRPVLLLATVGSALSAVLLGLSTDMSVAIGARAINGLAGGTMGIANTYLVDVTSVEERPGYVSNLTAYLGLGIAIGPIVGGYLYHVGGVQFACYGAAIVSLINFLCVWLTLKESNPSASEHLNQENGETNGIETSTPSESAAFSGRLWVLFVASALQSPLFVVFDTFALLYIKKYFCHDDEVAATKLFSECIAMVGIALIIIPMFVYQPFLKCVGFTNSIIVGSATLVVGLFLNAMVTKGWMFLLSCVFWVAGSQLSGPTAPIMIGRLAPPGAMGRAFGVYNSFGNVSRVIAPAAMTPLYNWVPASVFVLMSGLYVFVGIIYFIIAKSLSPDGTGQAREVTCESVGIEASMGTATEPETSSLRQRCRSSLLAGTSSFKSFGALPEHIDRIEHSISLDQIRPRRSTTDVASHPPHRGSWFRGVPRALSA